MDEVKMGLKRIFEVATVEEARKYKDEFIDQFGDNPKLEKAIEILEEGFEDAIQYLNEKQNTISIFEVQIRWKE